MAAKHDCEHFDDGVMPTECEEYEPSEPPYCAKKDFRGTAVCDDTEFPCDGCTDYAPAPTFGCAGSGDSDIPF